MDSVEKPNIYLKGEDWTSESNELLWGAVESDGEMYHVKTIYDPCPAGYKVAPKEAMNGFALANVLNDFDKGYYFPTLSSNIWIPAPGYIIKTALVRGNPTIYSETGGYIGYYWASDPYNFEYDGKTYIGGYYMKIANGEVKPVRTSTENTRAFARSIRCVKVQM